MDSNRDAGKTKGSALLSRILVGAVGIPFLVFMVLKGELFLLVLVDLIIVLGLWEFYRMLEVKGICPFRSLGIGGGLLLSWQLYFKTGVGNEVIITFILLVIMVAELARRRQRNSILHIAVTILGIFYVGWLSSHFILLRELPRLVGVDYSAGGWYLLAIFIITWICDTGAYGLGRAFGRHPLLLRVSPKKTVEGAIGGLVSALLAGLLLGGVFLKDFLPLRHFVIIAIIVGTIGQIGDLVESLLKRDVQIKDTSRLLPGHGGVLDRFDSLLFIVPVTYWYLKILVF
ncbi:phosphatidate cytidylyltransferase [bacterium]|nr:phosphatidate cytidylyltransferase [bacterium]